MSSTFFKKIKKVFSKNLLTNLQHYGIIKMLPRKDRGEVRAFLYKKGSPPASLL
jgi:hypothetical protein